MTAETLISHYNSMDGKPATTEKLKGFHGDIQKFLDSAGHGSMVPVLVQIQKRITNALKLALKNHADGFEVVSVSKIDLKKKAKLSKVGIIGSKDPHLKGLIHGLECISDDKALNGKPLEGLSDTTYKVITDKILELIKTDGLIWRKPWNEKVNSSTDMAHNHVTKHVYRGGNYYLNYLLLSDYSNPKFFTLDQVNKLGGKVKKGSAAWPVVYFKWLYKDIEKNKLITEQQAIVNGKLRAGVEKFPALFYYSVFNYEQCEDLKVKFIPAKKKTAKEKIESAEAIIEGMPKRPQIKAGPEAWYSPSKDLVQLVPLDQFSIDQQYYSVGFHELIHSTAHSSRVGRELKGRYGDKSYAFEELIAELGASYLCGESGILYYTLKNSAAYIKSWSSKLRDEMNRDPKFFLRAASQAQKAADFMLARGEFHDLQKIKPKKETEKKPDHGLTLQQAIVDLWHISRTALAASTTIPTRGDRMNYVKKELARTYPDLISELSNKKVWFAIEDALDHKVAMAGVKTKKVKSKKKARKVELKGIETESIDSAPKVEATPIPKKTRSAGLGFTTADKAPAAPANLFSLPGEIGRLLGNLQRYKLEIVLAGETHSSKSELGKQIADAFLSAGDDVAWVDWEQGGLDSKDTLDSIQRNIKPENRKRLHVSSQVPKTLEAVKSLAKKFKVVILDSGSSLKQVTNVWIDELREKEPDTVWVILMQQNEKGGTRGGAAAEFDSPIVLKTYRPDQSDYKKNYAYVFKNRGNPETTGKYYLIDQKKIVDVQPGTAVADPQPKAAA